MQACDFSSQSISLPAVKAAGFVGAISYASDYTPKNWTQANWNQALALRLSRLIVCEQGNQPALRGAAGGSHDAAIANAQADALGYSTAATMFYVAEDPSQLPSSAYPTVEAYFQAVNAAGRRAVGAYGGWNTLNMLHSAGLITKGWMVQTWNQGAPDPLPPWIVLVQMVNGVNTHGLPIDVDDILAVDWGQDPRPHGAPPPAGAGGQNMLADDPSSKSGSWYLAPDGGVFTADGSQFYGSMAGNRFNWQAVGTLAGISAWWDGTGWGYKIAVATATSTPGVGPVAYYRFPSNGSLRGVAAVGAEPITDHPTAVEAAMDTSTFEAAAGTEPDGDGEDWRNFLADSRGAE
jgi:Rv2525c-like, glycoside hydrolase-like domain